MIPSRFHSRLMAAFVVWMAGLGVGKGQPVICQGMCDASAVVPLGQTHFAVANDEDNTIRVYNRTQGGAPVQSFDLSSFLRVRSESPEADLEAAAPIGNRVYWISSHGANKNGKERPNRRRFFATQTVMTNGVVTLIPLGRPYVNLVFDLSNDPRFERFDFAAAARRVPKTRNALNIEGLCATPDGSLLIGFRNPIPGGKALIIPLLNPEGAISDQRARYGDPLLLDLRGLGIRSLARAPQGYWIIAGSFDGGGTSQLFHWNGSSDQPRSVNRPELAGLNPESIEGFREDGQDRLLLVSDDGTLQIGGVDCKTVKDPNLRYFRATTLVP